MPWIVVLGVLLATGTASALALSPVALAAWMGFDAALAGLIFRAASRPRAGALGVLAMAAAGDALWSLQHLARSGLGHGCLTAALRIAATAGPIVGTAGLAWASWLATHRLRRSGPAGVS